MEKSVLIQELLKHRYAHRGLHAKPTIPENSMAAFARAVEAGYGIELDLHLTRDGKLAVIHDASLKRTCGVNLKIEDLTLAEARDYPLEESDERIPEFCDFLRLVDGKVPLVVELKAEGRNEKALTDAAMRALADYTGLYLRGILQSGGGGLSQKSLSRGRARAARRGTQQREKDNYTVSRYPA